MEDIGMEKLPLEDDFNEPFLESIFRDQSAGRFLLPLSKKRTMLKPQRLMFTTPGERKAGLILVTLDLRITGVWEK
jgi:hypothetical protein